MIREVVLCLLKVIVLLGGMESGLWAKVDFSELISLSAIYFGLRREYVILPTLYYYPPTMNGCKFPG